MLFDIFIYALPPIVSVLTMLLLVFHVYAVLGVAVFGSIRNGSALTDQNSFRTYPLAMMLLLRMVTGENWNDAMREAAVQPPLCTAGVVRTLFLYLLFRRL